MVPEDDDGADVGGGPPPDPSTRAWRHPSEIAAAAAAANRDQARPAAVASSGIQPAASPRFPLLALGGTALSAVFLVGLTVYLTGGSLPGGDDAGSLLAIEPRTPASSSLVPPSAQPEASVDDDPAADQTAAPITTTTNRLESTTTVATVGGWVRSQDDTAGGWLPAPAFRPWPAELFDGVFDYAGAELERIAGYVQADGLFFTSASAIADRPRIALLSNGIWAEAELVGVDEVSDVAVLIIPAETDRRFAEGHLVSLPTGAADRGDPEPGTAVAVASADDSSITDHGAILGIDEAVTTTAGATVYGALTTSAHRPEDGIGAPLLDLATGDVIGLVLDTSGPLASAVPIERVRSIGQSLVDRGVPATEWLGIRAVSLDGGGVRLEQVTEGGPGQRAGLRHGDRIIAIDGVIVVDVEHLIHRLRLTGAGTTIAVEIDRDGDRHLIETTIGTRTGAE